MSEDEDEELAMLRLQALMSKRRGGAGPSKDLPFPLSLPPLPAQPVPPVSTEVPVTTSHAVVTSAPAAVTDALPDITDSAGTYRQPRFLHGQPTEASYCNECGSVVVIFACCVAEMKCILVMAICLSVLCVCLSVTCRIYTLLHRPGRNLGEW